MKNIWIDSTLALAFLRGLIGELPATAVLNELRSFDVNVLAKWLTEFQLAAVATRAYGDVWPELASALTAERFTILAQNSMLYSNATTTIDLFNGANIDVVLLKGCALAEAAWGGVGMRPMSDVDLWVRPSDMPQTTTLLRESGFNHKPLPLPLERMLIVNGELEFVQEKWQYGLLDVHWLPIHGWWVQHCANFDFDGMWARRVPINIGEKTASRLSNEDQLIHLATHATINAHLGKHAGIRGMLDMIFASRVWPVDWDVFVERVETYRVKTAVWFILDLAHQFFGWDEIAPVLKQLAPNPIRQAYLKRLINVESILSGQDISPTNWRYALILGLVDRPRDLLTFFYRAIIPDQKWQEAKYGEGVRPWHHALQTFKRTP